MGKGCVGGEKNAVAGSDGDFHEKIFKVTVFFSFSIFLCFFCNCAPSQKK